MSYQKYAKNFELRTMNCPACDHEDFTKGSFSVVSPWVIQLADVKGRIFPEYKICKFCDSGWFGINYSEQILGGLYKSYRGPNYFEIRNSWEPTYTKELNSNLNNGEKWLVGRRRQILMALEAAGVKPQGMQSVLDFGGGHGGVMPTFSKRYLLEANEEVMPEPGVELVRNLIEAKTIDLDLVMCCGVLEHLNSPIEVIKSILELNSSVFLFEVPTGTPTKRVGPAGSRGFLGLIASTRLFWRIIQKIERKSGRRWRKYFPLRCSEHLQFFSESGLRRLLERSGLAVLLISETKPNESLADEKNLGFEAGLIAVCKKSTK
jgi:Methyltransferase domain